VTEINPSKKLKAAGFGEWRQVVQFWKSQLTRNGMEVKDIIREIKICAPPLPDHLARYEVEASWWLTDSIDEDRVRIQIDCDEIGGVDAERIFFMHKTLVLLKREQLTSKFMWRAKDSEDLLCAVLIQASHALHTYSYDRPRFTEKIRPLVTDLHSWTSEILKHEGLSSLGYTTCAALPATGGPWWEHGATNTLKGYIAGLAREQVGTIKDLQPIYITRTEKRIPELDRAIKKELERQQAEHQAWEIRRAKQAAESEREKNRLKQEEEANRKKFPRWGQWGSLTDEELCQLVWSMPTTQVAQQFGITDSCIGKRCRKFGIKKPPRGFWAKVETGKLPHPQGKPVKA
jgi:sRNA-binding protein